MYEEEFDENAFWSKPSDTSDTTTEDAIDPEADKANALIERGAK